MHQTVRDFLMTPPIQSFLVAKLPTGFDVNSYMFQVLVTQMRLASQMSMQIDFGEGRLINMEVAHYARKLEAEASEGCDLIDKLLPQIPYICLAWATDTIPTIPGWSSPEQRDRLVLLLFTISQGLHAYVARQLDADPSFLKLVPSQVSMLYCALSGVLKPGSESDQEAGRDPDAILKTVRIILSQGASPNEVLKEGGTPWTHLTEVIRRGRTKHNDRWAGIVAALIEAGACDHAFDHGTKLPLGKFSAPQQRRLALTLRTAKARGFTAWYTRHFMCYLTFAMAKLRGPTSQVYFSAVYMIEFSMGAPVLMVTSALAPVAVALLLVWVIISYGADGRNGVISSRLVIPSWQLFAQLPLLFFFLCCF